MPSHCAPPYTFFDTTHCVDGDTIFLLSGIKSLTFSNSTPSDEEKILYKYIA